jgi:hypothetical protein
MNTNCEDANVNGSLPTAAESTEQPTNLSADRVKSALDQKKASGKVYKVWITADVEEKRYRTLSGNVSVYATNEDKAVKKVEAQIKDGTLDDLEMTDAYDDDWDIVPYYEVQENLLHQTFDVELSLDQDDFDPDEAIEVEIEDLVASICWNTEALAKHKAFLESLLNEGDYKQAVRRSFVVKDDVDPSDVLEAEVEELQAKISWSADSLAKHKAFLESLPKEGDHETEVAV